MKVVPVQVKMADGSPLCGVMAVSVGYRHTVALKSDGTVWTWGDNQCGQLGDATRTSNHLSPMPVKLANGSPFRGVIAIAAGARHTVALKADGTVWGFGQNERGALGIEVRSPNEPFPVQAKLPDGSPLSGITAIAVGWCNTLARKEDGTMWVWGANDYGQIGDGTSGRGTNRSYPVQVRKQDGTPLVHVIGIAAGALHTVAIIEEEEED